MMRRTVWGLAAPGLLLVVGCFFPVGSKIDATVCHEAALPRDLQPWHAIDALPSGSEPAKTEAAKPEGVKPTEHIIQAQAKAPGGTEPGKAAEKEEPGKKKTEEEPSKIPERFTIPPELLPGGRVTPLELPRTGGEKARRQALAAAFPPLPALGPDPQPVLGPEGKPLTLSDLQRLALANSPLIKQAAANVEAMRGAAIQAGLPPNPTVGYEADTMGTTGGAGYQGAFIDQVIRTAGKLQLNRAIATMDLANAELAFRRAQTDLATTIRGGYFAVLVAEQSMRLNRALVDFTQKIYEFFVASTRLPAAPYEPMYLRALTVTARASLVAARNRYVSAWKQLAANMGLTGLPPTQLVGRVDMPIPVYNHKAVLSYVLAHHTDVLSAENTLQQSRLRLRLAQVTPIPDVDVRILVQRDFTGPPFEVAPSLQVSVPLPVWDRNQGGIIQAQSNVVNTAEEPHRVRNALTRTLADAFERYENNRILLAYYRDQILPDYARFYQGVLARYYRETGLIPPPGFVTSTPGMLDIVVAQQNLAGAIGTYLTTLDAMWKAVVDVTDLLQTNDMFQVAGKLVPTEQVAPIPEPVDLKGLPCKHPCSPIPGLHQYVLDRSWPLADPSHPAGAGTATPPATPSTGSGRSAPTPGPKQDTLPAPRTLPEMAPGGVKGTAAPVDPLLLAPPPPLRLPPLPPP
jgi:cobalt-zinc-cadmium efflux system outer membrane protein